MKVGDSFDVTHQTNEEAKKVTSKISSACCAYSKKNCVKFTIRKIKDRTIRVWRVS